MTKWSSSNKFARMFILMALCTILSWWLPDHLAPLLETAGKWVAKWGPLLFVAILALTGYSLATWVPRYDWAVLEKRGLSLVLFVESILALTIRFWYTSAEGLWVVVWALATVVTITHLSGFGRTTPPTDNAEGPSASHPHFLVDSPILHPGKDALGRSALAAAIVNSIGEYAESTPITLSLNGGWGTGKSSVMKLMQHDLESRGYKTAWVNAWVYDTKTSIWRAMIQSIIDVMKEHHLPINVLSSVSGYYKAARDVVASQDQVKWLSALMQDIPSTDNLEDLKEKVSALIKDLVNDKKLVVFVDDLDRCAPENVLGTLEFLKEIVNFEHCVFIVGMDRKSVETVLARRYKTKGRDFLRKIINVTVDLPAPSLQRLSRLFRDDIQTITGLKQQTIDRVFPFMFHSVDGNPRAIKQVLNSFLVVKKLLDRILDLDQEDIVQALLLGELLRFKYPEVHSKLGDQTIFEGLRSSYWDYLRTRRQSSWPRTQADPAAERWYEVLGKAIGAKPEVAAWVSQLLELGGLLTAVGTVLTTPKSIFFTYIDPPDWIPESRMMSLLADIRDGKTTITAVLTDLENEGLDRVREFISRCVNLKNEIYRANDQAYTPGGQYATFSNAFLRDILTAAIRHQRFRGLELFPRKSVQPLLAGESKHESEVDALSLAQVVLEKSAWTTEALLDITKKDITREYTLGAIMESELRRLHSDAASSLWRSTLEQLSDRPVFDSHPLYSAVVNLGTDFLGRPDAHRALVEAAAKHGAEEGWVANFRLLLHSWLEWARTEGDVNRVRSTWVQVADSGLLEAVRKAIDSLNLRPTSREAFNNDMWSLEQMTDRFRNPSTDEEERITDSE